jgi:hypothetical protein
VRTAVLLELRLPRESPDEIVLLHRDARKWRRLSPRTDGFAHSVPQASKCIVRSSHGARAIGKGLWSPAVRAATSFPCRGHFFTGVPAARDVHGDGIHEALGSDERSPGFGRAYLLEELSRVSQGARSARNTSGPPSGKRRPPTANRSASCRIVPDRALMPQIRLSLGNCGRAAVKAVLRPVTSGGRLWGAREIERHENEKAVSGRTGRGKVRRAPGPCTERTPAGKGKTRGIGSGK